MSWKQKYRKRSTDNVAVFLFEFIEETTKFSVITGMQALFEAAL